MERRVLVAVFLSFLVLYGYQTLFVPPPSSGTSAPAPSDADTSRTLADRSEIPSAGTGTAPSASSPTTAQPIGRVTAIERPTPDPVVGDTAPRDIVVESDAFRAVFTNRGGELVSWQLKDYLEEGRPVELIPRELPPEEPWPFTLSFGDEDLTHLAHEALFQASSTNLRLDDRSAKLVLEYEDATGLAIRKVFTFDPALSPYVVGVTIEAKLSLDQLEPTVRWGPALGGVESQGSGLAFRQGPRGVVYGRVFDGAMLSDPGMERLERSDVATQPSYGGQFDFLGVDNHYFIAAALPEQREATINYRAVPLPSLVPDGEPRDLMAFDIAVPGGVTDLRFYLGPKDFDILEVASAPLVRSIDFGFLSVLVVPLHRSLKWVYGWVGNYGFAIIVLTLLINIVIFPLRHKSVTSMRKMSEIQPEMKAIQARYANLKATDPDKQKMNQEVMALYRDRGVNPVSGCLPMLLTMPVLFAFYRLLSMSIEMRGAPFVLWITDLSVHDPMYVTPVIMGVSMLVQHRLTPSQADPMQQRIMMFMPIVFTFMFLWAPAGLVVYWLTSNLLGIGQQVVTNRIIGPPKVHVVRPPAERRVKTKKGAAKKGAPRRVPSQTRGENDVANDLESRMTEFVQAVTTAMGLDAKVEIEPIEDGTRIAINGGDCQALIKRKAAGLDALQHVVNAAFRREHPGRHIVVDCLDYRKGKDAELRETAKLLAERARETGAPQEIGPLNPYARRIVHLTIAEDPTASSESVGDAFMKTVVITAEE